MTIKPIETRFDGHIFRSRTEARWAVFFKAAGIRYEYEKEGYALPSGWYLPDFFLPEMDIWLEVKGSIPSEIEVALLYELHLATGKGAALAIGAPEPRENLIYIWDDPFDHCVGWRDYPRYCFVDDRRNEGEFWLLSDSELRAHSLGPVTGPYHGKYPGVYAATARGYAAARAARFGR